MFQFYLHFVERRENSGDPFWLVVFACGCTVWLAACDTEREVEGDIIDIAQCEKAIGHVA
jgi:hypothetical protein